MHISRAAAIVAATPGGRSEAGAWRPLSRAAAIVAATAVVSGGAAALAPAAQAGTLTATLVATRSTSVWGVPSPDPAGITYDAQHGRLVLSDSEADEMPLYKGTNVFFSTLDGKQDPAAVGWTTEPWSYEPAGV